MIEKIFLMSLVFSYTGCIGAKPISIKLVENKKSFCNKKLESKSLEFLEQQYRCTNN